VLLERDTELTLLRQALRAADSGTGALIVISGMLGSGKTALLQALSEVAEGVRVLRSSGSLLEQEFAFGVARQIMESTRISDPVLSTAAGHERGQDLARVFDDAGASGEAAEESVAATLCSVLERISTDRPLLILVDDLQWVDEPTLHCLGYLAKRVRGMRILLAATVREGEARADSRLVRQFLSSGARTLRPSPLSRDAARTVVRDQFGEPGDEEFVLACHEATRGNPLFLVSVLSNLKLNSVRPVADHAAAARSLRPAGLRDRLISCLRAQPRPVREFAKAFAVLGEHTDLELAAELAGLDGVSCAEALRAMYRLGLLAAEHEPRFSHPIVKDAAEACMTIEEHEQAHVRAVELRYERGSPAEQIAAQLLAITSPQGRWAVEILQAAADTALRRGAADAAAGYLRRALLDTSLEGEDRAIVLADLAAAERGFDPSAALRHISYAVPLFRSARARAAAVTRITPALLEFDVAPSMELLRRSAAELGVAGNGQEIGSERALERDLALRLEARLRHAEHCDSEKLGDSVRRLRQLGPDPPLATGGERELLTVLLHAATLTAGMPSDELARMATRILEREPASPAHVHTPVPLLSSVLVAADAPGAMPTWLDMVGQQLRRQQATPSELALIRTEQAVLSLYMGRLPEAGAIAAEVSKLHSAECTVLTRKAFFGLTAVALEGRDIELIERLAAHLKARGDTTGGVMSAQRRLLRGHAAALRGDWALALEHYLDSGRQLNRLGWRNPVLFPWRPFAARLYQRLGDISAARRIADENHEISLAWGSPTAVGRALRLSGMVTAGKEGIALLRQAVETLHASANMLERARAHLALGRRLRAAREPEAEDQLNRSCQLAAECGAEWLAERAKVELGGGAGPRSRRADRRTLTSTEFAVATVAADGDSNQEIAAKFGVRTRTVEKHLTNSYRKLGVQRREELADALRAATREQY
jgi:DNA-binding CsgD family transcriptional regulator